MTGLIVLSQHPRLVASDERLRMFQNHQRDGALTEPKLRGTIYGMKSSAGISPLNLTVIMKIHHVLHALLHAHLSPFATSLPSPEPQQTFENWPADWPTNVILTAGDQFLGTLIPQDGTLHQLAEFTCLELPAYAVGPCNTPSVDQIGIAVGSGPCTFLGRDGFSQILSGLAGEGFYTVGPPQALIQVACG